MSMYEKIGVAGSYNTLECFKYFLDKKKPLPHDLYKEKGFAFVVDDDGNVHCKRQSRDVNETPETLSHAQKVVPGKWYRINRGVTLYLGNVSDEEIELLSNVEVKE